MRLVNKIFPRRLFLLAGSALVLMGPSIVAQAQVADNFESGDFKYSANGFSWGAPNKTAVVRDDGYIVNNGSPVQLGPCADCRWTNGPASVGRHALKVTYVAGTSWAEQTWSSTVAYREMWASWWIRIPVNYKHPTLTTSVNQKLFMFWMDGYSSKGDGSTVGMEFRPNPANPGGSVFYVKVSPGGYTGVGSDTGSVPFIAYPEDQGRWMQLVVQISAEQTPGSKDGQVRVWRRWQSEATFTQTHDLSGQPVKLPVSGPQGFSNGYLMGWANGKYEVDTEFLIDDFTLSATSLLSKSPNPPSAVVVQ